MNLLIADDEPLIHVSIEYSLKELGLSDVQIYHAYNGTQMKSRMEETSMDLALVDIRMPGISGLEAIEFCREHWPDTFYYIMSGFSEFEYAREAIRLSVTDYLLKPLEPKTLDQVISRVRDEKSSQKTQVRDAFRSWLEGAFHHHEVGYLYAPRYYTAIILLTYDMAPEQILSWMPGFVYLYHEYILSLPCAEGMLLLVFSADARPVHEILQKAPRKDYPEGVTCFLSSVNNVPDKTASQLHTLLASSAIRVFRGLGVRYDLLTLPETAPEMLAAARQWIALRDSYFNKDYAAYTSLSARLPATILQLTEPERQGLVSFLQTMTGCPFSRTPTSETLHRYLLQAGQPLLQPQNNGGKIEAVLTYVEENFFRDISVAALAAQFELSPNYLSTLLKQRLGMKFTDYLARLRIAHAKELLLSTRLSLKEITNQIGYYSESHFIKIFTEREGCSPTEFRAFAAGTEPR